MNRVIKKITIYSLKCIPFYNFTVIPFSPDESLKRELKFADKLLFYENQWKFTVQNCSGDDQAKFLKN